MEKRQRSLKKNDVILLCAVLAAGLFCLLFFALGQSGEALAVISVDGVTVREISLKDAPDETFTLAGRPVSFTVSGGEICFTNVDCPDHICENYGFISKPGETAVCMPNKTALVIKQRT